MPDLSPAATVDSAATAIAPPSTVAEVRAMLAEHTTSLRALGIRSLRLFGSVARGVAHDGSDVDLLVEFERETDAALGLFEFIHIQLMLESWLRRPVDLVEPSTLRTELHEVLDEAIEVV